MKIGESINSSWHSTEGFDFPDRWQTVFALPQKRLLTYYDEKWYEHPTGGKVVASLWEVEYWCDIPKSEVYE